MTGAEFAEGDLVTLLLEPGGLVVEEPELDGAAEAEADELQAAGFVMALPALGLVVGEVDVFWQGDFFAFCQVGEKCREAGVCPAGRDGVEGLVLGVGVRLLAQGEEGEFPCGGFGAAGGVGG